MTFRFLPVTPIGWKRQAVDSVRFVSGVILGAPDCAGLLRHPVCPGLLERGRGAVE